MNSSATLTGCDDIIKRLREAIAEHPLSPIHGYAEDIAALLDRLDAAEAENERLLEFERSAALTLPVRHNQTEQEE